MIRSPSRPIFVLFGDSITQRACGPDGWATIVADAYQRRVDVITRGYSGYNTRWARQIMDDVFPSSCNTSILLTTIFFGANDAALPERTS
jgi:lysophospholipase L1-like esterase